jgi:hypothetical protein
MTLPLTHDFTDLTVAYAPDVRLAYPLTDCCGASGKGSADAASGVVCRSCYREVSPLFGDCAPIDDESAVAIIGGWTDASRPDIEAQVTAWRAVPA